MNFLMFYSCKRIKLIRKEVKVFLKPKNEKSAYYKFIQITNILQNFITELRYLQTFEPFYFVSWKVGEGGGEFYQIKRRVNV